MIAYKEIKMEKVFIVMAAGLVIALIDQIYMLNRYSNISKETIFVTFCLMLLNVYFAFFDDKKHLA